MMTTIPVTLPASRRRNIDVLELARASLFQNQAERKAAEARRVVIPFETLKGMLITDVHLNIIV